MKFIYLGFFLSVISYQVFALNATSQSIDCMIYNEEYKTEYLYALMGLNLARRSVYTWSPLVIKEFNPNLPENCSNLFLEDDKQV